MLMADLRAMAGFLIATERLVLSVGVLLPGQ